MTERQAWGLIAVVALAGISIANIADALWYPIREANRAKRVDLKDLPGNRHGAKA